MAFNGKDLTDSQHLVVSVKRVSESTLATALTCLIQAGSVNHPTPQITVTTYFNTNIMGHEVPFCGQDQTSFSSYVPLTNAAYDIMLNRPDGYSQPIDISLARRIVSSINIHELR